MAQSHVAEGQAVDKRVHLLMYGDMEGGLTLPPVVSACLNCVVTLAMPVMDRAQLHSAALRACVALPLPRTDSGQVYYRLGVCFCPD